MLLDSRLAFPVRVLTLYTGCSRAQIGKFQSFLPANDGKNRHPLHPILKTEYQKNIISFPSLNFAISAKQFH